MRRPEEAYVRALCRLAMGMDASAMELRWAHQQALSDLLGAHHLGPAPPAAWPRLVIEEARTLDLLESGCYGIFTPPPLAGLAPQAAFDLDVLHRAYHAMSRTYVGERDVCAALLGDVEPEAIADPEIRAVYFEALHLEQRLLDHGEVALELISTAESILVEADAEGYVDRRIEVGLKRATLELGLDRRVASLERLRHAESMLMPWTRSRLQLEVNHYLAIAEVQNGLAAEALARFERCDDLYRLAAPPYLWMKRRWAEGVAHRDLGDYAAAAASLDRVLEDPRALVLGDDAMAVLMERFDVAVKGRDPDAMVAVGPILLRLIQVPACRAWMVERLRAIRDEAASYELETPQLHRMLAFFEAEPSRPAEEGA